MGPKSKQDDIWALWYTVYDEPMESKTNSSEKKLDVHPDEGVEPRLTRVVSR